MKSLLRRLLTWFFDWCDSTPTSHQGSSRKSTKCMYKFKDRVFWCDPVTVERLNKALALSNSEDRYKRVLISTKNTDNEENRAS